MRYWTKKIENKIKVLWTKILAKKVKNLDRLGPDINRRKKIGKEYNFLIINNKKWKRDDNKNMEIKMTKKRKEKCT